MAEKLILQTTTWETGWFITIPGTALLWICRNIIDLITPVQVRNSSTVLTMHAAFLL
jgi:hypothetical protein